MWDEAMLYVNGFCPKLQALRSTEVSVSRRDKVDPVGKMGYLRWWIVQAIIHNPIRSWPLNYTSPVPASNSSPAPT